MHRWRERCAIARRWCLALLVIARLSTPLPAAAHQIKVAPLDIEIGDSGITFASDLIPLEIIADTFSAVERSARGESLSDSERSEVFRYFDERLNFTEGDRRLRFQGVDARIARRESDALDHLVIRGFFSRSPDRGPIQLEARSLFDDEVMGPYPPLPVAQIAGPGYRQIYAFDGFAPFTPPETTTAREQLLRAASWIWEGVWHIFIGYDHILFLLGLHLVSPSFRETLKIVTAFTISHTITLTLAATGLVRFSPGLIEPVIALTIIYVGVENLIFTKPEGRWKTAFVFGFIHGFGFASALGESLDLDLLSPWAFASALCCFNIGVEIGQACVVGALSPFWVGVRWIPGRPWVVRFGSAAISCAGLYWFVQRIL
jgi:hydrogenase/urease accessory protein HupE